VGEAKRYLLVQSDDGRYGVRCFDIAATTLDDARAKAVDALRETWKDGRHDDWINRATLYAVDAEHDIGPLLDAVIAERDAAREAKRKAADEAAERAQYEALRRKYE
jgi:hypothetical protein